jgi:hypothetical protein
MGLRSSISAAMAPLKGLYWVPPVMIMLALLTGASLAPGHHSFYSSLNGTVQHDRNVSNFVEDIPEQQ